MNRLIGESLLATTMLLAILLCSFAAVGCGRGDQASREGIAQEAGSGESAGTTMEASSPETGDATKSPDSTDPRLDRFDALMAGLSIFVLAVVVGFEVITKVPPTLHTPLMSGSNAISGITLVGALLVAGRSDYAAWLGVLGVAFAMINVIGGFWVTHRMLSMFKR